MTGKRRRLLNKAPHGGAHAKPNIPPPPEVAADAERRNRAVYPKDI